MTPPIPRWLSAALASAALVAAVTAVIALLEPGVPALGLGVLYLRAVVPIAVMYGSAIASAVSLASSSDSQVSSPDPFCTGRLIEYPSPARAPRRAAARFP